MAIQLKGLLGKTPRPIIINGKLLCEGRNPIRVYMSSFKEVYRVSGTQKELTSEQAEEMINSAITEFRTKYDSVLVGTGYDPNEVSGTVDSFSGAIILNSKSFTVLASEENHRTGVQHTANVAALLKQFMVEYICNYYDIYVYLLNRRISAQHMPSIMKAHFTHGLFQPIIVSTADIKTPLAYDENAWMHHAFRSEEKYLERQEDGNRKLNLSCIAMCDIARIFNAPIVLDMDRKEFVLITLLCVLSQLDQTASQELSKKYSSTFSNVMNERSRVELFSAMMKYATKTRTALKVV